MQTVQIAVAYDFICPWCWIGHQNLAAGIAAAELNAPVAIRYMPFELNPSMPAEGMDRREYRSRKFGNWARSQAMDAQVTAAGLSAGVTFNYARVERTPNTRLAHRLMQFAQAGAQPQNVAALYQGIFAAYFSDGRDIGSLDTLLEIARASGIDAIAARDYLLAGSGAREVDAARGDADALGIQSVPTILSAGQLVSGAQPALVFAQALRSAAQRSAA